MRAGVISRTVACAVGLLPLLMAPAGANPVILFEPETNLVLLSDQPDQLWHPASITKLMTAYVAFEAVKAGRVAWDADVPLSEYARIQPATRIGLRAGIKINLEEATRGMILRSANDFAVAIAERIGGTEGSFVQVMNHTARRLGMTRTRFKNPHGLPDLEQVTTARDMAILTSALIRDFPERADVFSSQSLRIYKGTFQTGNDLLRTLEGADGMKTGFTCASGYNVVASATRAGHRLVAIVLGAENRSTRSALAVDMLERGFAHFRAAAAGDVAPEPPTGHAAPDDATGKAMPPIVPTALKALALSPAETLPVHDMSRETRTGKCGNSSRPVRRRTTQGIASAHRHKSQETTAAAVTTGSLVSGKARKSTSRPPTAPAAQGDGH